MLVPTYSPQNEVLIQTHFSQWSPVRISYSLEVLTTKISSFFYEVLTLMSSSFPNGQYDSPSVLPNHKSLIQIEDHKILTTVTLHCSYDELSTVIYSTKVAVSLNHKQITWRTKKHNILHCFKQYITYPILFYTHSQKLKQKLKQRIFYSFWIQFFKIKYK